MREPRHSDMMVAARFGWAVMLIGLTGGCASQFNALRTDILPRVWERGLLGLMQHEAVHPAAGSARGVHRAYTHNRAGLSHLHDGHYFEAIRHFELAIELAPRWAEPRENLGRLYEETGRVDRAIALYESSLAVEPGRRSTIRRLALVYVKAGRRDRRARQVLTKVATDPNGGRWNEWAEGRLARIDRS